MDAALLLCHSRAGGNPVRQAAEKPHLIHMSDVALAGKRVLMRVDLNVPMEDGKIAADHRIRACLPSVRLALERGAAVILMSHLGRPKEGVESPGLSLAPVARRLGELLEMPVRFTTREELEKAPGTVAPGKVVLLENLRFNRGERNNNPRLAATLAALGDVFVMDAFGSAHREHASTCGVARFAEVACAGPLLRAEVGALGRIVHSIERPMVAVIGGAKVSTKLGTLDALCGKADVLVPGGGIANTLLVASGYDVGASLHDPGDLEAAGRLKAKLDLHGARLLLPEDVVCATSVDSREPVVRGVDEVAPDEMILDVGPRTCERIEEIVADAATIVWGGPVGVFEREPFAEGTRRLTRAIAASDAYSVAGGGDTLAAMGQFGFGDDGSDGISYVSTGGSAMLQFIEKGDLPALVALRKSSGRAAR